nr:translocation/assembly module TamB domain-containing protein [uncultured Desulfobulbus sp.]
MKIIKRLLLVFSCIILLFLSVFLFAVSTEAGLRALISLANSLGANIVSFGSVSGTLLGPLQLRNIRYADGTTTVAVDSVDFDWHPSQLLHGRVELLSLVGKEVKVVLGKSAPEEPKQESGDILLPAFRLPVDVLLDTFQLNDIVLSSAEQELQRIEQVRLSKLSFKADQLHFADLSLVAAGSTVQLKGGLQTNAQYLINGSLDTHLALEGYPPIVATASLTGPLNQLKLTADVQHPSKIHLAGDLKDLLKTPSWSMAVTSDEIALQAINAGWPEQSFRKIAIQGHGTFSEYNITLESEAGVPGLEAPVTLGLEVEGNDQSLTFPRLSVTQHKARLTAQGSLQWSPLLSWQADIEGTGIDPAVFLPEWPGHFSLKLATTGKMDQSLLANFQLAELNGTLRGYPLTGKGKVEMEGDSLRFPEFLLSSGGSRLEIKGATAPNLNLDLRLHSKNLAEVVPKASGTLEAKAHLAGTTSKPNLDLQIDGTKLAFEQNTIGGLKGTAKGLIASDGLFTAAIQLDKLSLAETPLDRATLALQGSLNKHSLKFAAQSSDLKTGCELHGRYADGAWQGNLQQTHLSFTGWGDWRQQKASDLLFSASQMKFAQTCLATPSSSVCLDGSWKGADNLWQLQAKVATLPLSTLAHNLGAPWPVEGTLSSTLQAQGKEQQISKAHFSADTDGLQITAPLAEGKQQKFPWKSNSLRGEYGNNQLNIKFSSLINEQNSVQADIRQTTPDLVGGLLTRPLQGTLKVHLQDLELISILSDQAVIPAGTLQGTWNVQGPLSAPRFTGDISLQGGQAELPPLGITLSPLQFSIKAQTNTLDIEAMAHSGSGELKATSTVDLQHPNKKSIALHLVGENFQAAKLPGMEVVISPDLALNVDEAAIKVEGSVKIPKAKISSIDVDQATAPSSDVVVIDDDKKNKASSHPLFLNLDIAAGDEVKVDAYGLRAMIAGKLHLDSQPGRPLIGNGTLAVKNGTFTLLGKRLKIDVGRILYTASPLDNPGIELRSERTTDDTTVGVNIDGFLQHPEISFYSTPAMEQSAIMRKLLEDAAIGGESREDIGTVGTVMEKIGLGGLVPYLKSLKKFSMIDEIKYEEGDDDEASSVVLGSWLTSDLYVSYGKSLGNDSATFNTKFKLGKGFSLMTETSATTNGGDIKYELER